MSFQNIIDVLRKPSIIDYLKARNIKHLWLTGSYAQGSQTPASDIDLIFEENDKNLFDLRVFEVPIFLEEQIFEKKVDMIDVHHINKHIKPFILQNMIHIW